MSRKVIYKYELKPDEEVQKVPLKKWYKILSVIEQADKIQLYAIVDIDSVEYSPNIYVYPTGRQLPDNIFEDFEFVDTVSLFSGNFVAHIFRDKDIEDILRDNLIY